MFDNIPNPNKLGWVWHIHSLSLNLKKKIYQMGPLALYMVGFRLEINKIIENYDMTLIQHIKGNQ